LRRSELSDLRRSERRLRVLTHQLLQRSQILKARVPAPVQAHDSEDGMRVRNSITKSQLQAAFDKRRV